MSLLELSAEQRRQLIDAQQVFLAWRPSAIELATLGGLYWNKSKGVRYLYEKRDQQRRSLGRETPGLVARKTDHDLRRKRLEARTRPLEARLKTMAPVNRALRLGRLPALPSQILRKLDFSGVLGDHIIVAGTNALYAYEIAAGIMASGELVATGDADFLWDSRRYLELAAKSITTDGLLGLLRQIDETFDAHYGYNATNGDGYVVDLISPDAPGLARKIGVGLDLETTPMNGADWLLNAPRFEEIGIGADGLPLRLVTPEPRTFALHKLWLSERPDRRPLKRPRDRAQAHFVAELAQTYLGLRFAAHEMPWLPNELKDLIGQLRR